MLKGKLIVFEGNDGAGKSTLVRYFSKYLTSKNIMNTVMKFNMSYVTLPSIKEGKKRDYGPYTNTLLHATSIVDQLERFIFNELKKGKAVICDRYMYSVIVRAIARGVKVNFAESLLKWVIKPDYVFYIDISPEKALKRKGKKNISFWEAGQDVSNLKDKEFSFIMFQNNLREIFLNYSKAWNFIYIDSEEDIDKKMNNIYNYITKQR